MPSRRFIVSVAMLAIALAIARGAESQPTSKVLRIGYLSGLSATADALNRQAFRQGLHAHGYIEGQNTLVEERHADGNVERLPQLAMEIVRLNVDVVVTATTPAVRAVQQATATIPVVMAFAGDPVGDGLVRSLARPGGNTTGLSAAVTEMAAKRVEFLKAVVPRAMHFLLLTAPGSSNSMVSASEKSGQMLGTRITTVRVRSANEVTRALSVASNGPVDGVIVDLALRREVSQILQFAARHRLPSVSGPREFAVDGGLLAYGADYPDLFRRAASFVDRIVKGAKAADLPVEQPTKFNLVVNLNTAEMLGLTIPSTVLTRADELIR